MRRVAIIVAVVSIVLGALVNAGAGDTEKTLSYSVVFDDAFGVVEGADFKVGGVPVGQVSSLEVERKTSRAIVNLRADDLGFGGLRSDARCSVGPQSLIGEYFVDCQPGTRGKVLSDGGRIPVEQTTSPIPADLVNNVLRKPYRERLRLILNELGVGLAARGPDLNATIRRAIPAITETNKVLEVLGDNRRTLQALARDGGQVMRVLGRRREDVGDFVVEARDAAEATAVRRAELAETFREFPPFLDELRPTLAELGTTASRQAPALRDLRIAAPAVTNLLNQLGPFTAATRVTTDALGEAAVTGRRASREAASTVDALRKVGETAEDPANNLRLILNDLDDRSRAVEPDPDSPEGKGYTGFEAIAQYMFDQSLAINIFDQRGYLLKLNALVNECSGYTDAQRAKDDPERTKRCSGALGPNQPGINQPDPSPGTAPTTTRRTSSRTSGGDPAPLLPGFAPRGSEREADRPGPDAPASQPDVPGTGIEALDQLLDGVGAAPPGGGDVRDLGPGLLDFLLAP